MVSDDIKSGKQGPAFLPAVKVCTQLYRTALAIIAIRRVSNDGLGNVDGDAQKQKKRKPRHFVLKWSIGSTQPTFMRSNARTGLSQGEILNVESVTRGDWRRARGTAARLARS